MVYLECCYVAAHVLKHTMYHDLSFYFSSLFTNPNL